LDIESRNTNGFNHHALVFAQTADDEWLDDANVVTPEMIIDIAEIHAAPPDPDPSRCA
jgi:hypothetical protein